MGKASSTPLLFQSKLVCFSLLYLFTSLFLALYTSLSQTKCLFRSSPFDPIQAPLFSYPSTYGEHKYAIPTHRTSCSSPVYFSEYWMVLKEIQNLCKNSSWSPSVLRYLQGKAETFAGNLSTQARIPYFVHYNESTEIPCGFLKKFPISDSDRTAMENCKGVVVVSAIFNDHDKIRQPRGLGSETLDNVCFFLFIDDVTLKGLDYHRLIPRKSQNFKIGAWRVVKVLSKKLYENPAMNGVIPKYLVHRLFPNSKFSIWIDAKLQLVVDPLLLIHSLVVSDNADMAISKHPYYVHTMEEAMATARWQKWSDVDGLKRQMETYCENGLLPWTPSKLPYPSVQEKTFLSLVLYHSRLSLYDCSWDERDVPDSALILRKHGLRSNLFSCLLFNELEAFNPRDQLAFAYVRDLMSPRLKINMFDVEVFEQIVVEYRHNIKREGGDSGSQMGSKAPKTKKTKRASPDLLYVNGSCCSKCQKYLLEMWGEES